MCDNNLINSKSFIYYLPSALNVKSFPRGLSINSFLYIVVIRATNYKPKLKRMHNTRLTFHGNSA